MPKISILCSNYNREKYIGKTIESILSQDFKDFELLIVDDGSDDNSCKIISNYVKQDARISFWVHENQGLTFEYKFLLSKISSETEYVTWIDSDDIYAPDNLQKRLNIFQEHHDVHIVYNNLSYMDANGGSIHSSYSEKFELFFFSGYKKKLDIANIFHVLQFFKLNPPLSYGSLMIRRKVFNEMQVIVNPTLNIKYFMGDLDIFFRIVSSYASYGMDERLLCYRVHENQITKSQRVVMQKDLNCILSFLYKEGCLSKRDYFLIHKNNN